MRTKTHVEYQIQTGAAGNTAAVRIVRFVAHDDGTESRSVIAEATTPTDTGVDVDDWTLTTVHEFREALELGPNKFLASPESDTERARRLA